MSATTLLLINGLCAFIGSSIGSFLGVFTWFKRQSITIEVDKEEIDE